MPLYDPSLSISHWTRSDLESFVRAIIENLDDETAYVNKREVISADNLVIGGSLDISTEAEITIRDAILQFIDGGVP